ncbi:hypothetical protein [Clostridium sp.]|uniref:hypothetical protein n=1 Tax=Clostridium sp. TaxID=1506 RepID=UPI003D6CB2FD
MTDDRQISILRNSWNLLNRFTINNSNNLVQQEIKDGEVVSQNEIAYNIKDYSASIDMEDKIHIIFINDGGDLKYMVLPECNNIINVASEKQDLILRCISIKMLLTVPHIFYVLTDAKRNSHIIHHSFFMNGYWQLKETFQSVGPKLIKPYFMARQNSEIYILIYLNHDKGKLALYRLDNANGNWVEMDKHIELKDSSNVCFFISPSNIAVIAYNKLIYKNIQTIIMHKNLAMETQEVWDKSILSDKNANTLKPSIFFKKDDYYMTWEQGDEILLKRSKDLILWKDVITFNKNFNDHLKCFYMNNNSKNLERKINSVSLLNAINANQLIKFNPINEISNECLSLESGQSNDDFLEEKILILSKRLERNTSENNLMKKNIVNLNNLIAEFEDNIIELNKRQVSSHHEINIYKNNFLDKVISLNKKNDILLLSNNNKLWELFNLIREKDKLINDLYMKSNK